jgi:hypothetical protein
MKKLPFWRIHSKRVSRRLWRETKCTLTGRDNLQSITFMFVTCESVLIKFQLIDTVFVEDLIIQ